MTTAVFYRVVASVLDGMIKSSNNPAANELKPPTKAPNAKLKFVTDLDGKLKFPAGRSMTLEIDRFIEVISSFQSNITRQPVCWKSLFGKVFSLLTVLHRARTIR